MEEDVFEQEPTSERKPRRSGRFWGCLRTAASVGVMAGAAILGAALIVVLVVYNSLRGELSEDLERLQSLEGREDFQVTRIYDRSGEVLLYEVFDEGRRTEVTFAEIPIWVQWATIATEDDTFYTNPGFDPQSIARAALEWYQAGEIVSGGSTITQQLVKQIVFEPEEQVEQTLRRKMREAALAYVLTQQIEKDDILTLYLNEVYYGNLAYGIEGAANVYFDKPAADLTLSEAAFLTGLIQSPVTYDPYTNFQIAKDRQAQVLSLMVLHGYLSDAEAAQAYDSPPLAVEDLADPDISLEAPHFTVEVRNRLGQLPIDPALLSRGGLEIYTTIDMRYQQLAEEIANEQVALVRDEFNMTNASIVVINPTTGEVLAMLGSLDYEDDSIDGNVNVALSPQQPGSTFKALTYALALEQGKTAADIIWDVPMAYDTGIGQGYDYEPVNYDLRFHGPVRMRDALANSYNIPAVTTARDVGIANLLDFSRRMGIESLESDPALYGLSLTLGGGEVTPLEMTTAYAVFANGGRAVTPILIDRVTDRSGSIIYEAEKTPGEQLVDPRIAWLISDMLSDNAARTPAMGSESPLRVDFPAAAKTGTTNDFRDNWTIGYTPHVAVGVWTGNTNNEPMADGVSGLSGAAPLWNAYISALYDEPGLTDMLARSDLPPLGEGFTRPEGMEARQICAISSLRDPQPAEGGCPVSDTEWFIVEEEAEQEEQPTATPIPTVVIDEETGETATPPAVRTQIEPGVVALGVLPLSEEQRAALGEQLIEIATATFGEDIPRPSAPPYCELPQEDVIDALGDLSVQLFIEAPADPIDAIRARTWAFGAGVPIEPGYPCNETIVEEADAEPDVPDGTNAEYAVLSPEPGATLFGPTPIVGSAVWDRTEVDYYKLEIGAGTQPNEWLTFGETHTDFVVEGVLEVLKADALAPGPYVIRLILVRSDGNFVQPIVEIPVTITDVPPTPTPED